MVYVLGQMPSESRVTSEEYFLCSLKSAITTACSTRYNASSSGQTLDTLCNPEDRTDALTSSFPDYQNVPNWRDIGFDLLNAMSLNTGMIDGNSSFSRVFTQLQLVEPGFPEVLPSPAEALLAMATCTALDLTWDIPFYAQWVSTPL